MQVKLNLVKFLQLSFVSLRPRHRESMCIFGKKIVAEYCNVTGSPLSGLRANHIRPTPSLGCSLGTRQPGSISSSFLFEGETTGVSQTIVVTTDVSQCIASRLRNVCLHCQRINIRGTKKPIHIIKHTKLNGKFHSTQLSQQLISQCSSLDCRNLSLTTVTCYNTATATAIT